MKAMMTLQDLIEEAKLRTVYWALCIFTVTYFLTHTSKSMWMNVPIAVLIVCAIRILCNEVEFRWKVRRIHQQSYLAFLEKKQLSVNDYRLTTTPPPPKWKRKIDSPLVEAAMEEFIQKLLKDFVTDLWYSDITPDKEAPELMHAIIMDVLAEISARLKEINLVDLLTRDVVDLVGDHLDLFRRNQAAIGVDVMKTLSSGERDDRLKHHLMDSKELHPALISADCEYKVLQRLMGGLLAVVLRPREAQCPLARCISRELLTCLVMQPVMNFASPGSINELIEFIFLSTNDGESKMENSDQPPNAAGSRSDHALDAKVITSDLSSKKNASSFNQSTDLTLLRGNTQGEVSTYTPEKINHNLSGEESLQPRSADWARMLDAATQRRTEVLMPENLENMWARGRNYKKKLQKTGTGERQPLVGKGFATTEPAKGLRKEELIVRSQTLSSTDVKALVQLPPKPHDDTLSDGKNSTAHFTYSQSKEQSSGEVPQVRDLVASVPLNAGNKGGLKRSNSTSDIQQADMDKEFRSEGGRPFISEFYSPGSGRYNEVHTITSASDTVFQSEGTHDATLRCRTITSASDTVFQSERTHNAKLRCRVVGAYFEKLGSKSFAVYSIAVTDLVNNTWFVKRRYRNFERLHRQLKDIPNYTLHLPPKRIFSSSTEDSFVHQRCIQLDKYLQDLLSIANVAEQHEVWDFLSVSSKNYSFGKSPSVMKTLAVNVDDAVDDIVRQFKGVSDGLMRKVVGSSSYLYEDTQSIAGRTLSLNPDEISKHLLWENTTESAISVSDNEEGDKDGAPSHEDVGSDVQANGWHSDNESNAKSYPPRVVQPIEDFRNLDSEKKLGPTSEFSSISQGVYPAAGFPDTSDSLKDLVGVPPEWTPPNLSVPVLNLVDKMFQLKRRGWLRRQVLWISKQILQLMMEDAIDDWLLRQIRVLRRDDVIAQGIHWVQDALWPGGTFFTKVNAQSEKDNCQPKGKTSQTKNSRSKVSTPGSFEQQLEATRRASDIKNMMFNGAPSTLVSLIGHKQYRRCARDMYYFLQSSVCLKQLAYGILELVLISVFPELRDVVKDVHEKMSAQVVD